MAVRHQLLRMLKAGPSGTQRPPNPPAFLTPALTFFPIAPADHPRAFPAAYAAKGDFPHSTTPMGPYEYHWPPPFSIFKRAMVHALTFIARPHGCPRMKHTPHFKNMHFLSLFWPFVFYCLAFLATRFSVSVVFFPVIDDSAFSVMSSLAGSAAFPVLSVRLAVCASLGLTHPRSRPVRGFFLTTAVGDLGGSHSRFFF